MYVFIFSLNQIYIDNLVSGIEVKNKNCKYLNLIYDWRRLYNK